MPEKMELERIKKQAEIVKKKIQTYIKEEKFDSARAGIEQYERMIPKDPRANDETVKIRYRLEELRRRSNDVLTLIMQHLNIREGKVLEIECKDGVITRALSDVGFDVMALDDDPSTRLKWIGMEMSSKVWDIEMDTAKYMQVDFDLEKTRSLTNNYDAIIYIQRGEKLLKKYSAEECAEYLYNLASKARKYLFSLCRTLMTAWKKNRVRFFRFSRNLSKQLFHKFFERRGQKVAKKRGLLE